MATYYYLLGEDRVDGVVSYCSTTGLHSWGLNLYDCQSSLQQVDYRVNKPVRKTLPPPPNRMIYVLWQLQGKQLHRTYIGM